MKILINSSYDTTRDKQAYSGASIFARNFLASLARTRHSFTALSYHRPAGRLSTRFKTESRKEGRNKWIMMHNIISVKEILTVTGKRPSPKAVQLIQDTADQIRKEDADVFVLNGFSARAYLLFRAAKEAGLPVVAIHHGLWFKEGQALKKRLKSSEMKVRLAMEKQIDKLAEKNIFLNEYSLEEFQRKLGKIDKKQAKIIPLPYDPVFLNRTLPKPNRKSPGRIGLVARWDRIKNHDGFLALAKEAKKQGLPWEFHAVTRITDYPLYNGMAARYRDTVKITPPDSPAKLKKFYQAMDLVLIPSRFETYSAVAMEAILQNRPVMVSPHVPWSRIFRKFGLGQWVCDFKNPAKTVKIMRSVMAQTPPAKLVNYIRKTNDPARVYQEYVKTLISVTQGDK